jgi:GDP-L-fucose synthase
LNTNSKIYIAGHTGLVGSAILRKFEKAGFKNIAIKTHVELDLMDYTAVRSFYESVLPEYVILSAAKVGGIAANINYPADFLYDNLVIQNNIIRLSYEYGIKKLLFLASSCIYPRLCNQPMKEEYLLDGKLEPTNEGYAIAKIAGLKLCEYFNKQYNTNFISIMPCNVYGIGDNFNNENAHVVSALIRKFHTAKIQGDDYIKIWGTGNARREFIFNEDLAEACYFLMGNYDTTQFLNIGTGVDYSICELANIIKEIVGFQGDIIFDTTKPDGMPQKLLDVSRINTLGWKAKYDIHDGIIKAYEYYTKNLGH